MGARRCEILSNEELRDIKYQRAEDDEDIARLLAFIGYLKRKLGNAQRKVDEQRKHLNAIRVKVAKGAKGQDGQGDQETLDANS